MAQNDLANALASLHALAPMAALADKLGYTLVLLEDQRLIWSNQPTSDGADCHTLVCGRSCEDGECALETALTTGEAVEITLANEDQPVVRRIAAQAWSEG